MRKKLGFLSVWFIYLFIGFFGIKWSVYDTWMIQDYSVVDYLLFPFIVLVKLFIVFVILIIALYANYKLFDFLFSNKEIGKDI